MQRYEYKVVPAPTKGQKAKGVKTPEGRFAQGVQAVLNAEGSAGWEYLRAELLPSDERTGLTGSTTNWRNVLVFRREIGGATTARPPEIVVDVLEPEVAPVAPPVEVAPVETPQVEAPQFDVPQVAGQPAQSESARKAESLITVSGMFAAQKSRDGEAPGADVAEAGDQTPVEKT